LLAIFGVSQFRKLDHERSCVASVAVAALQSVRSRASAVLPRVEPRKLRRTDLEVVAVDQGFVVGPRPRALVVHRAYALARAVLGHAPGRASARRPHACARPAGHAAPSALGYPHLVLVAWSSQERRKISRNAILCSVYPNQSGAAGAERRWASTQCSSSPFNPWRARCISFVSSTPTSPLRHPVLRSRATCTVRRRHRAAPGPQATPSVAGHPPDHLNTAGAQESNPR
jgi:hypothetical protein